MQQQAVITGADSDTGAFRDLDGMHHAVSGASIEIIQLDPGDPEERALRVEVGESSVDRGSINRNLRVEGGLDARRYAVGLFRPGAKAAFNGVSVDPSTSISACFRRSIARRSASHRVRRSAARRLPLFPGAISIAFR